jgi:hypothetical protein
MLKTFSSRRIYFSTRYDVDRQYSQVRRLGWRQPNLRNYLWSRPLDRRFFNATVCSNTKQTRVDDRDSEGQRNVDRRKREKRIF